MSKRLPLVLAAGLLAAWVASCVNTHPMHEHTSNGPLPGISAGMESAAVRKALGNPNSEASGWWMGGSRFNMRYKVWYYEGKGRVVFGPDSMDVSHSEADPSEDGRPSN
jgi:hypothetical protein